MSWLVTHDFNANGPAHYRYSAPRWGAMVPYAGPAMGAGSSDFAILTFPDFVSLTGGPRRGGSHLSVTQS
jgi:hypothetical protein